MVFRIPYPTTKYDFKSYLAASRNRLGSSNILVDENGTLVNIEEYYPFGEMRSIRERHKETIKHVSQTSFGSYAKKRYRFCGKEKDSESGMYYYGARYYSPWLCRFVSVDPLAGKYPFYTPFQYAGNKPIISIDIDGLEGSNDTGQQNNNPSDSTSTGSTNQSDSTVTPLDTVTVPKPSETKKTDPIQEELKSVTNVENVLKGKEWIDYQDIRSCGKSARLQNNKVNGANPVYDGNQINMVVDKHRQDIQDNSDGKKTSPVDIQKGVRTLISSLANGKPVVVGVNYKNSASPGNDNVATDHYVNIVGMGKDEKGTYFSYYDNYVDPTSSPDISDRKAKGTDVKLNRFYYDDKSQMFIDDTPTTITGPNHQQYGAIKYVITEVKPNQ